MTAHMHTSTKLGGVSNLSKNIKYFGNEVPPRAETAAVDGSVASLGLRCLVGH